MAGDNRRVDSQVLRDLANSTREKRERMDSIYRECRSRVDAAPRRWSTGEWDGTVTFMRLELEQMDREQKELDDRAWKNDIVSAIANLPDPLPLAAWKFLLGTEAPRGIGLGALPDAAGKLTSGFGSYWKQFSEAMGRIPTPSEVGVWAEGAAATMFGLAVRGVTTSGDFLVDSGKAGGNLIARGVNRKLGDVILGGSVALGGWSSIWRPNALSGLTNNTSTLGPKNMAVLAGRFSALYAENSTGTPHPVRIVRTGPGQYVVLIAGTMSTTSNDWWSNLKTGTGVKSAYMRTVRAAILETVREKGAEINLVGHSQGGNVANLLGGDKELLERYKVNSVTTFGSPSNVPHNEASEGTHYHNFAMFGDPVPLAELPAKIFTAALSPNPVAGAANFAAPRVVNHVITSGESLDTVYANLPSNPAYYHSPDVYAASPELNGAGLPFTVAEWTEVGAFEAGPLDSLRVAADEGNVIGVVGEIISIKDAVTDKNLKDMGVGARPTNQGGSW